MPIYEYRCEKCGNELEVMHKVSDPSPTECPKCHEQALSRLMSRTSFQLKGGGWYSDLYSSTKKGDSSSTSTPAAASSSASTSSSTTSTSSTPSTSSSSGSSGATGGSST